MVKDRELTKKERLLVSGLAEGKKMTQAALEAGYAHRESGSEAIKRPIVRQALERAFRKQGISDSCIAKKIKEGLEAVKTTEKGAVVNDFATRHKYVETVLKVKGDHAPEKLDVKSEHEVKQVWNIIKYSESGLALEEITMLKQRIQELEAENKSLKEREKITSRPS